MKPHFLAFLSCLAVVLCSCGGNSTNPSDRSLGIHGRVVDATGKPVVGAEIVQLYGPRFGSIDTRGKEAGVQSDTVKEITPQEEALFCSPTPVVSDLFIQFDVEEAMPISLTIINVLTGKDVVTLSDKRVLVAGNHTFSWRVLPENSPTSSIHNGVYRVHLVKNQTVIEKDVLVNSRKAAAIAVTDSDGKFFIEYKYFPIGFRSDVIDVTGRVLGVLNVSPASKLLVRKQGVIIKEQDIVVDKGTSMDVAITVPQ